MYANTCWGFLGLAVALGLAVIGLTPEYAWLRLYFIIGAVVSAITSGVLFLWPAISRLWSGADTASKTVTTRVAFSETQSIKHWPPFLGGSHTLRLDNVATLRFHHPSSLHSLTLLLDVVPTDMAMQASPGVEVDGAVMYEHAPTTPQYLFDTDRNKRKEITVAGRTFIVTLREVKRANIANVGDADRICFWHIGEMIL